MRIKLLRYMHEVTAPDRTRVAWFDLVELGHDGRENRLDVDLSSLTGDGGGVGLLESLAHLVVQIRHIGRRKQGPLAGFEHAGGDPQQHWLILRNGDHVIGLFQGMFPKNTLTFNPGWDQQAKAVDPSGEGIAQGFHVLVIPFGGFGCR